MGFWGGLLAWVARSPIEYVIYFLKLFKNRREPYKLACKGNIKIVLETVLICIVEDP
jgi:hypothetical protein